MFRPWKNFAVFALTLALLEISCAACHSQFSEPFFEPAPSVAAPVTAPVEKQKTNFSLDASWNNGLLISSADDEFRIHVGGNAQVDTVWLMGPAGAFALPGGGQNGVENSSAALLRRARMRMDGTIYGQFDYILEYDFANANNENDGLQPPSFGNIDGSPTPCNIWMQIREVPGFGNVRMGNQVKPIGMSNNTNQAFLPFMERPDNMDAFYGPFDSGFALGISSRNWSESERMTWQYGVYAPAVNVFGVSLNKYAGGGRVTALPWLEAEEKSLIHIGCGFFGGQLEENKLRLRDRPLLRNAPGYAVPVLVDTGTLGGTNQFTFGPEFAAVLGSLTLQAEWAAQFLTNASRNNQSLGTVFYQGGYVEALYFLSGEVQEYLRREGVFGRVEPINNYRVRKGEPRVGSGAWQIGARFSYLDLNNSGGQGGQVYDWTFGLNWLLNPNMRMQFNYILEHRDGPQNVAQGWLNGLGARIAYDF
jgi:phosphate-selective porin OprO/OprP